MHVHIPKKLRYELRKWVIYGFGLFLLSVIIYLFDVNVVGIIATIFLIIVASFSKIYKQFTGKLSLGFELITPVTVLFAYKFSIFFALSTAFIMLMISSFISGKIDFVSTVCEMITYVVLCVMTAIFRGVDFVQVALVMVVMRDVVIFPLGVAIMGRNFIHLIIVVVTNIFFNILVVLWFGNFFAGLL